MRVKKQLLGVDRNVLFLFIIVAGLAVSVSSCQQNIDSRESANEAISQMVEKTVRPTTRENQTRANISLSSTNLLSLLPDLNEYPIVVGARDSATVESVEIFTSSEKAGRERDGFYLALADMFNRQRLSISNGKQAVISIR